MTLIELHCSKGYLLLVWVLYNIAYMYMYMSSSLSDSYVGDPSMKPNMRGSEK